MLAGRKRVSSGVRQNSSKFSVGPFFVVGVYVLGIYLRPMNPKSTPQSVLRDIAQIQHMERGTLNVLRQGPQGPYYNHQCYEQGRNVSRYVPAEQVSEVKEAIQGHHRFQELAQEYVQLMVEQTRAERAAGHSKKNKTRHPS